MCLGSWRRHESTLCVCFDQTNRKASILSSDLWYKQWNASGGQVCHDLNAHWPVTNAASVAHGQAEPSRTCQNIEGAARGQESLPGDGIAATRWQTLYIQQNIDEDTANQQQTPGLNRRTAHCFVPFCTCR